jgi:hypothetical protein
MTATAPDRQIRSPALSRISVRMTTWVPFGMDRVGNARDDVIFYPNFQFFLAYIFFIPDYLIEGYLFPIAHISMEIDEAHKSSKQYWIAFRLQISNVLMWRDGDLNPGQRVEGPLS